LGLIGEISTSIPVAHSTNITHDSIQQCLLFRKTWVSWQIPEMMRWQWHQLDNTPIICIFNIIIHYRQLISTSQMLSWRPTKSVKWPAQGSGSVPTVSAHYALSFSGRLSFRAVD